MSCQWWDIYVKMAFGRSRSDKKQSTTFPIGKPPKVHRQNVHSKIPHRKLEKTVELRPWHATPVTMAHPQRVFDATRFSRGRATPLFRPSSTPRAPRRPNSTSKLLTSDRANRWPLSPQGTRPTVVKETLRDSVSDRMAYFWSRWMLVRLWPL